LLVYKYRRPLKQKCSIFFNSKTSLGDDRIVNIIPLSESKLKGVVEMSRKENPIAIIDSGVGGLTVVKELQAILPKEDIIYFGDSKNVPYGSKSQEEIIHLSKRMLDFLVVKNVKLVGIGCNTISSVLGFLAPQYDLKLIGAIDPYIGHIAKLSIKKFGLIATPFTVKTRYYNNSLAKLNRDIEIIGQGCPRLATIIDQGNYTKEEIALETKIPMANIKEKGAQDTVILACTHYPIIMDYLQELYPDTTFINPAHYQALAIKDYLLEQDLLNEKETGGRVKVFTTGKRENYRWFLNKLGIKNVESINKVE
jgi:glutamate racemase